MGLFNLNKINNIEFLEASPLSETGFLLHGFTARVSGVSAPPFDSLNFSTLEGDAPASVAQNWSLLAEAFHIAPDAFMVMRQLHGDGIIILDGDSGVVPAANPWLPESQPEGDAFITDRSDIAIGVKTADCIPLFLVDREQRVVAAVHAGRRGAALKIAARVTDVFVKRFASRMTDILAVIGPAIGRCCYEVDDPVCREFRRHKGYKDFLIPGEKAGRWMLDLPLALRYQLLEVGLPEGNIFSSDYCTSCKTGLFFSHRRDGTRTGRHYNFIMIRNM